MDRIPTLLGHAGGWDELLLFAIPAGVYLLFRWWDRSRGSGNGGDDVDEEKAD